MIRCLLISGIFPPDIGGPARYVPALAHALQDRGFYCSVLTLGELGERAPDPSLRVHHISRRHRIPVRMALTVRALRELAADADILLSNGLYVEAAVAARLSKRPLVTKVVGDEVWDRASRLGWTSRTLDDFQDAPADFTIRALKALRRYSLAVSKTIIVPSQYTRDLVCRWVPGTPVTVIPNAVAPRSVPGRFPLKPELRTIPKLAFVGRLISLKRVDALLSLISSMPGVGLVVAGDGPERPALMRMASELGVLDRVQFTGAIDEEAVWSLLRECELLVLNSTTENCPHVLLEAMAIGLPVVSTRVGGVPEIVQDGVTGVLVDAQEPAQLKSAIARLLGDRQLRERLATAAKASMARFSWSSTADAVASVMRQACTS